QLLDRARQGMGAGRAHRGGLRLRLEPLPRPPARLRVRGRAPRPALARPAGRPHRRGPARDAAPPGRQPAGGRRRLPAAAAARPDPRCAARRRAPRRAGHVLHPPLGAGPRPAARARAVAHPRPALRRARPHGGEGPAAARGVLVPPDRGNAPGARGPVMPVPAPTETRLELADPPDGAAWDRFVEAADGATFCHLWAWRAVMEDALGHECLYRAAVRPDGSWAGLLPL